MQPGDIAYVRRITDADYDERGRVQKSATWAAPKGHTFVVYIVGIARHGQPTTRNEVEEAMTALGWTFKERT